MRSPTAIEIDILDMLFAKAKLDYSANDLKVENMDDGNMGSLKIGSAYDSRTFGECVSEFQFKDSDNIDVIASLNVDSNGNPYELDVWKVDFSATNLLRCST